MSPTANPESIVNSVNASNKAVLSLVGTYISHYRRLNGYSDSLIALRVGCSRQAIHSLRRGNMTICSISFVSRIAEAFGLNFVELIDEARKLPKEGDEG